MDQTDENEDGTNNDEWAASRVANCSHQLAQSILRRYQVSKPFMLKEDLKIGSMDNGKAFSSMVSGRTFSSQFPRSFAEGDLPLQPTRHYGD